MSGSKVRLFVKSFKTVTGVKEYEHHVSTRETGADIKYDVEPYETEAEPEYEFVLPEDQEKVVEMVTEAAGKKGLQVEVIDVTKENILHREIQEGLEKIQAFPTIVVGSDHKVEGITTKEQVDDALSHFR
jgi:hypothetical protein